MEKDFCTCNRLTLSPSMLSRGHSQRNITLCIKPSMPVTVFVTVAGKTKTAEKESKSQTKA